MRPKRVLKAKETPLCRRGPRQDTTRVVDTGAQIESHQLDLFQLYKDNTMLDTDYAVQH